jgi:hypothetical protein
MELKDLEGIMANILCYHKGKYNFYTTIADGFCYERGLTLQQVCDVVKDRYGQDGLDELPERIRRAHKNGHSAHGGGTLADLLSRNRAGDNEERLPFDECLRRFLS